MKNKIMWSIIVLATAAAFVSCGGGGGGGTPPAPAVPDIMVNDNNLVISFGTVVLRNTSEQTVTMKNDGAADLSIGAIAGASAPFSITSDTCSNQTISPAASCSVTVRFAPTGGGTFSANLGIPSNDPDETTVNAQLSGASPNVVFVTSVSGNGNLGSWADAGGKTGLAAGDAVCQARAGAAGLSGSFKAWLSDDNDDAYCRIHNLTGKRSANCSQAALPASAGPWVRTDGFSCAARIDELLDNGKMYTPVRFDEFGAQITEAAYFTNTYIDGTLHPAVPSPCINWTSSDAGLVGEGGGTDMTSYNWTAYFGLSCAQPTVRLLCMQTGAGPSLPSLLTTGKKVFLASGWGTGNLSTWPGAGGNSGLAAGDAICRARAAAAGLANADRFKAWLSDSTTNAKDRITSDGPWVRLDGVPIAENKADLLDGSLFTSINLTETGLYYGNYGVWSGTTDNGVKTPNTCNDWTDGSSGFMGSFGVAPNAGPGWSSGWSNGTSCNQSVFMLRCIED